MLTITAVTISGGTRVLSSVTKVPPMVCRVLVSQLGEPSETVPISRATKPRATPASARVIPLRPDSLLVGPDRPPLLEERGHALPSSVDLAGRRHDLHGGGVRVPLGAVELGVHRLLPPRLACPGAAGG